jgi:biopolymer transport protein ExbD
MAGGSSPRSDDGKKKARIEIIPLIDVIFFLLATFVLFTLSLDKIASIPVNLPVANPTPAPPDETMVSIQVSEHGTYYWKVGTGAAEPIVKEDIPLRLETYKNANPNSARVLISGDIRAKFGPAVLVLDEVRRVGIEQVSVQTTATPTGR